MKVKITISGRYVEWGTIWVHLQEANPLLTHPVVVTLPTAFARQVFDPHRTKSDDATWSEHIIGHIDEFGNLVATAYFESLAKLSDSSTDDSVYEWVIVRVDAVSENNGLLSLVGMAVEFRRDAR